MYRFSAAWLCAFALSACNSTPTHHYQLPDSAFHMPQYKTPDIAVKIVLSEPLNTSGLLYQTDAHRVNMAQKNLWSAPLENTLPVALSNKLNRLTDRGYLPYTLDNHHIPILTVYFDRFQGTYLGHTEISGYARFADGTTRSFQVHTPQNGDGYSAMLDSLNQGLDEVARQIAN